MEGFETKNPYSILGLEQGHLASLDDIKKARPPAPLPAAPRPCALDASYGRSSLSAAR